MNPFIWLIFTVLDIYTWIVIAMVVMSWLVAFNVLNPRSDFVRQVQYMLVRLTEPLLGPIRRFLPNLGGLDISPIILLVGIQFVKQAIAYYVMPMMYG